MRTKTPPHSEHQRADHKAELDRLHAAHAADLERIETRLIVERAQLQDELQARRRWWHRWLKQ
jgi:hypothetical protein